MDNRSLVIHKKQSDDLFDVNFAKNTDSNAISNAVKISEEKMDNTNSSDRLQEEKVIKEEKIEEKVQSSNENLIKSLPMSIYNLQ